MRLLGCVLACAFGVQSASALDWTIQSEWCSAACYADGDYDSDTGFTAAHAIANSNEVAQFGHGYSCNQYLCEGTRAISYRDVTSGGIYESYSSSYGEQYTEPDTTGTCDVYLAFRLAYTSWGGGMQRTTANGDSELWGYGTVKAGAWELEWELDPANDEVDWELWDGNILDSSGSVSATTVGSEEVFQIVKVKTLNITEGEQELFRCDVFMYSDLEDVDSDIQTSATHN